MDASRGAGARLVDSFNRGGLQFQAKKNAFRQVATNQDYKVSTKNRIIRVDRNTGTHNIYDKATKEFRPISHLEIDEKFKSYRDPDLLAKDLFIERGVSDFVLVVGKTMARQAVLGTAIGLVSTLVVPAVVKVLSPFIQKAIAGVPKAITTVAEKAAGPVTVVASKTPRTIRRMHRTVGELPTSAGATVGAVAGTFVGGPVGAVVGGVIGSGVGAAASWLF